MLELSDKDFKADMKKECIHKQFQTGWKQMKKKKKRKLQQRDGKSQLRNRRCKKELSGNLESERHNNPNKNSQVELNS